MEWTRVNEDGEIEFTEDAKLVPEVQALLTLNYNKGLNDFDGRKRYRAKAEAKYLRLCYSNLSPYRDYSKSEREEQARLDCKFPSDWKESEELKLLLPKFVKGIQTKIDRTLSVVENFLEKLEKHLNDIDLNERNASGGIVHDPGKIMTMLRQLPATAQVIQDLQLQVRLGIIGTPRSKGDHEIGWMMGENKTKSIEEVDIDD